MNKTLDLGLEPVEQFNHQIRQVNYQLNQLEQWIAPAVREIKNLKQWREELIEASLEFQRKQAKITYAKPNNFVEEITSAYVTLTADQQAALLMLLEQGDSK